MLVGSVNALLEICHRQFIFGVFQKDFVDLARCDLLHRTIGPEIDRRSLVETATEESDVVHEHRAGVRPNAALLNLRARHPLEWKASAAHVVEHLDGVSVQGIDLVPQLEQSLDRVRIGFRGTILERVDRKRIVQVCDHKELAVGGHVIAIDPHHIERGAEVGVCHLRQRRAVVEKQVSARNHRQIGEAIGERHPASPANVPDLGHGVVGRDLHQLGAHHAIDHAVPVDPAAVDAWSSPEFHNAISGPKIARCDACLLRNRNKVLWIRRPEVRRGVGVDAIEDGDLHARPLRNAIPGACRRVEPHREEAVCSQRRRCAHNSCA